MLMPILLLIKLSSDAMLALIALCLKSKFTPELSLLVGSLRAQSVETIGNKFTFQN